MLGLLIFNLPRIRNTINGERDFILSLLYTQPLITKIKCDACLACTSVCMCACVPARVAARHDIVLPAVRIKLLRDWHFRITDKGHQKSFPWQYAPLVLKKGNIKATSFSQPTLVLVSKHWIHCAVVAMVMRAIYLQVKRAMMQWAGCCHEVLGPKLILFEKQNVWPSLDTLPKTQFWKFAFTNMHCASTYL